MSSQRVSHAARHRVDSLLFDVTVSGVFLSALALACLTAAFLHLESARMRRQRESQMESFAAAATAIAAPLMASGDQAGLDRVGQSMLAAPDLVYVVITGGSGQVLTSAFRAGVNRDGVPDPKTVDANSRSRLVTLPGGPILETERPIFAGRSRLGEMRVGLSLAGQRSAMASDAWTAANAALLAMLLLTLTRYLQLRKLLEPLADLARAAVRLARNESIEPIRTGRTDELGQLGDAMNQIADQVRARRELAVSLHNAQEANRRQGEFLSNVSHQLRTPMNGIIGMTELALATKLTDEQREYLENVSSSSESLLHLLDDILDFSHIVAGKFELDRQPFSLRDLIGHTVRGLAVRAHQKGLELVWDIEENVPDYLVGDMTRLRQVVINLVANAVKFTAGGEILVRVQFNERVADQICLLFQVRDTGPGIAHEKQKTIFQAYAQPEKSSRPMDSSPGLGLAICSRLVHLMQGEIGVDSIPGRGSTFYFTALFSPAQPAAAPPGELTEPLKGVPVLIVDDNRTNLRILDRVLTNWGCTTGRAESADQARAAVRGAEETGMPFRVVLVDATMAERSAFVLAAEIKAGVGDPKVIMMLSSANLAGDAARCRSIGITEYVTKPVSQAALRAAIRGALDHQGSPRLSAAGLSILVAEDNPVNQRLAVRLLERKGYRVTTASNGREAIEVATKTRFDLILMDIQMPEMDGLAATAWIRERERLTGVHVPILASTAHAMGGDRERCLQSGMDGYVSKPFKAEALCAAIEEVVYRVSAMPPSQCGEYLRTIDPLFGPGVAVY